MWKKVVLNNKFYRTRRKFVGHYWYSKRVLGVRPGIHLNIYCSVSPLECFKEAYCDIEYFMTLFYSIAKTLGQNKVRTLTSSVSAFIYLSNYSVKPRIFALIVFNFPLDRISMWKQSINPVNLPLYSQTINTRTIFDGTLCSVN